MPTVDEKSESFITRAQEVHNGKYTYIQESFEGMNKRVDIVCPTHGIFTQWAYNHIKGHGCKCCAVDANSNTSMMSHSEWENKFKDAHGERYTYTGDEPLGSKVKIAIACRVHGVFEQIRWIHAKGAGCPKCYDDRRGQSISKSLDQFIADCQVTHGNTYDYSLTVYINSSTKVEIVCKKHGSFFSHPQNHINGTGCPKCKRSWGERLVAMYLDTNCIDFEEQKKFPDCKSTRALPFDFYLPEYNICIEYDGKQHYDDSWKFSTPESFERTKKNDSIKNEYCQENNILLVRIPYWEKDNISNLLDAALNLYNINN